MAAEQVENPLAMLIVKRAESTSLMSNSGDFMWFQIFIDLLIRMDHDEDALKELASFCKTIYQDNEAQLQSIEEFECTYNSSNAILWYTKATFLYPLLNKALRIQSFHTILAFRAFIRDISKQLQFEHEQQKELRENMGENVIIAYRGQAVSIEEFNEFKNSINEYFTINSFLSATLNRDIAKMYVVSAPKSDSLMSILIEIEAHMNQNTKAFASIAHLSQFPNELEILFMIGSTFRIRSLDQNVENFYILNILLCSENDIELKETFKCFKSEYHSCASLTSLGNVMHRMGELHGARDYYVRAIENTLSATGSESISSLNTNERIRSFTGLAFVAAQQGEFETALKYHEYVLTLKKELFPYNHYVIGVSYVNIGNVYYSLKQFDLSLSYYNDALKIFTQSCALNHPSRAKNIGNIGVVDAATHCFKESKEKLQLSMNILRENYPEKHPDIATCLSNIGLVCRSLQEYNAAEELQLKALDIRIQTLPANDIDIARSYHNLGILYETLNDFQLALYYYQMAIDIKTLGLFQHSPEYQDTLQCLVALRYKIQSVSLPAVYWNIKRDT
ncbi:unnamed protein product [Rotaria sp. Silwood2]|nr:unnamed protein product [Rotaria sp. Silwood2]CAF4548985.1 unnamed protein product [Rotaria sp. Silwood2]